MSLQAMQSSKLIPADIDPTETIKSMRKWTAL